MDNKNRLKFTKSMVLLAGMAVLIMASGIAPAAGAGSVNVTKASDSPSLNIANESANFTNILKLTFTAIGESANITRIVIGEAGTIHGTSEITGVGVNSSDNLVFLVASTFSADNGTATLNIPNGFEVPVGTQSLWVWVNTTSFDLGDTIKLNVTSFNATGKASGLAMTTSGTPESNVITGVGKLTVTVGPNSTQSRTINAGANTSIVLMQLNLTATIGATTLSNITFTENGTANGSTDFSAIYLVNDTNKNGAWSTDEPIKGTPATTFTANNGTATVTGISQAIPVNGSIYMLVVVNTTGFFWSGETLAVNISSNYNVTTDNSWGIYPATTPVVSSNSTTGQAKINVTVGAKQPYLSYAASGKRGLIEGAQLNFTAIAGQVNITQITLEQWTTTRWLDARNNTYPKIYIDNDGDGNVTSYDTVLNVTAGNFSVDNVDLVSNFTASNSSYIIESGNVTENTTLWAKLANGTTNIAWYNQTLTNGSGIKYLNISVNYTNGTGGLNRTFINFSDTRFNSSFYQQTWIDVSSNFSDGVREIKNLTLLGTTVPGGNTNIYNLTGRLVANSSVVNVTLVGNLTIGSINETTAGQATKSIIIAVNTTEAWTSANATKALPNTITSYGNFSNYLAYDNTTGLSTRIYQNNDPTTTNTKDINATAIPNAANALFLLKAGSTGITANVGKAANLVPTLQLNFSYNSSSVSAAASSTVSVRQITVSTSGTVNETGGNVTANLVVDSNDDGAVSAGEQIVATAAYTSDNQTIQLTPSTPLSLTLDNSGDLINANSKSTFTNVLIAINTSSSITLGQTVQFSIANTSIDYIADTGGLIMVVNQTGDTITGTALTVAGTITAVNTGNVSSGTVSSEVNESFVELMQLKFTASSTEAINVTNISVTWNGTGAGASLTSGIGIVNDSTLNGIVDSTETILNATTFSANVSVLNLSFSNNNITVPAGGSRYVVIYVNTSAPNINTSDLLRVNITAAPYLNYTAYGNESTVKITDLQTTALSSATLTAAFTGNSSVAGYTPTQTTWVQGAQTNFPVLGLNFSAVNETVNISSIKLTASGSANESGNVTARLVIDTGTLGSYESETILATASFTADNGNVTLTPSPEIQVVAGSNTSVLVIANITNKVAAGETVIISLNNPSTDYNATGIYSNTRIQDASTTPIANTATATGNVSVAIGLNTTIAGPITAINASNVAILQLNFSATPSMENVTITGINLTASGLSSDARNDTWGVGVYNDTNGNGKIDAGEVELGNGTFDANGTAVFTFHTNLTINGTSSLANQTFNNTVVYVNTSSSVFNASDKLQVRLVSYNATGVTSGKNLTAYGTPITSNNLTGTSNITASGDLPAARNILAGANTSVVVWQLNLTASTVPEGLIVRTITLYENGTANGSTDIGSVFLVNDTNRDGVWNTSAGDSGIIAFNTSFSNNGTLTLALTANQNISAGATISYLVLVNTTSTFTDGKTIAFNLTNSTSINATGTTSLIAVYQNFSTISSNVITGYGSIDVYNTTQPTGPIYNETANLKEVLKLNFSAPRGAVNITNITLKENGSATIAGTNGIKNVSVWFNNVKYNDTAAWATENGTLVLNLSHPTTGLGLIVDGTTQEVTIKVNTTGNLAVGDTIKFELNSTLGAGYNATGNVSLQIPNSTQNATISNTITVISTVAAVNQIALSADWNLISFPVILTNASTSNVTALIASSMDPDSGIWAYDAATSTWTSYKPGAIGNDLPLLTPRSQVHYNYGYWIKMLNATNLTYSGTFLETGPGKLPPTYYVVTGWNLIGVHSTTNVAANTYLNNLGTGGWSSLYNYSAATSTYTKINGSSIMNRHDGFWLYATQNGTIVP